MPIYIHSVDGGLTQDELACSRRSDSGVQAKKKANERAGKKPGKTGEEDEGTPVKLILKSPCCPL